jgi:hypothetical protein
MPVFAISPSRARGDASAIAILFLLAGILGRLPSTGLLARCGGDYLDLLFLGLFGFPIASLLAFGHVDFSPVRRQDPHSVVRRALRLSAVNRSHCAGRKPEQDARAARARSRTRSAEECALFRQIAMDELVPRGDPGLATRSRYRRGANPALPGVQIGCQLRSSTVPATSSAQPKNTTVGQRLVCRP